MALSLVNQSAALVKQVANTLVKLHLSETCGWYRAQTCMAHLTDRDATYYAISLPLSLKK